MKFKFTYPVYFILGLIQLYKTFNFLIRKKKTYFSGIYVNKSKTDLDFFPDHAQIRTRQACGQMRGLSGGWSRGRQLRVLNTNTRMRTRMCTAHSYTQKRKVSKRTLKWLTRPDTRQSSRGRLGRSSNAKTVQTSKMWRTDRQTDGPTYQPTNRQGKV